MNIWDFLDKHPVWGMVYLVIVTLGLNGISVGLGVGFQKPVKKVKKEEVDPTRD